MNERTEPRIAGVGKEAPAAVRWGAEKSIRAKRLLARFRYRQTVVRTEQALHNGAMGAL
jgi:hypothetical protein